MPLEELAGEYIALAFGIDRRFPGYIDGFFGPEEVKAAALAAGEQDPAALLARARALAARVAGADLPGSRRRFLTAQVTAMITVCRKLAGEEIDYLEEVRGCFDIEPRFVPESVFDAAHAELDRLLPGSRSADVRQRMIDWRDRYAISNGTARRLIDLILGEARRRTQAFVDLPAAEEVEIAFVRDKPWSGYNWYLGNARSRVDVNTDLPIHAHELTALIAHEAYPGHHTEHALKDIRLYQEAGFSEHAIQLINTPECVISEGIATLAESIIFPGDEGARFQADVLYPAAGIAGDPGREAAIARARASLRAVNGNAAILFHARGASEEEAIAYIGRYSLHSEEKARQSFRFIADPQWRPYTFTYSVGRELMSNWLDAFPVSDRAARFRSLLTDQLTPSMLAG